MRISDWSSDVCSSVLLPRTAVMPGAMPFDIHFADDDLRRLVRAVRRAGGHYLAPCGRERHRPAPPPDHPREYPEWVVGWGSGPVRRFRTSTFLLDWTKWLACAFKAACPHLDRKSTRLNSSH